VYDGAIRIIFFDRGEIYVLPVKEATVFHSAKEQKKNKVSTGRTLSEEQACIFFQNRLPALQMLIPFYPCPETDQSNQIRA
jgi:hypothetical protein